MAYHPGHPRMRRTRYPSRNLPHPVRPHCQYPSNLFFSNFNLFCSSNTHLSGIFFPFVALAHEIAVKEAIHGHALCAVVMLIQFTCNKNLLTHLFDGFLASPASDSSSGTTLSRGFRLLNFFLICFALWRASMVFFSWPLAANFLVAFFPIGFLESHWLR